MPKNNTWVHVTEAPWKNAFEVTATPPSISHFISKEVLESGNPAYLISRISEDMAKYFLKALQEQLSEVLGAPLKAKHSPHLPWDNSNADPKSDMMKFIEHDMKMSLHMHQKALLDNFKYEVAEYEKDKPLLGGPKGPSLGNAVVDKLTAAIPGFAKMTASCPDQKCTEYDFEDTLLRRVIIHLNDDHKWTRERIADWLETLDHDLTFKTPEEVNADAGHTDA